MEKESFDTAESFLLAAAWSARAALGLRQQKMEIYDTGCWLARLMRQIERAGASATQGQALPRGCSRTLGLSQTNNGPLF